ncbi:MAG: DUF4440 domain-containing protein [Phycisphaerales bacterium]|nr:DUF4440 domain-containing protein [Phycisphaerales bacterium]
MHAPPAHVAPTARLLLLSLLLPLAACSVADRRVEGERLMQVSRDWSDAAQARDVEATLSYWSDDAIVIPPGEAPLKGKAAIREYVLGAFDTPGFSIRWEPVEVCIAGSGELGYLTEHSVTTVSDGVGGVSTFRGRDVTIWRKDGGGRWRCIVDTWNEAPPEP